MTNKKIKSLEEISFEEADNLVKNNHANSFDIAFIDANKNDYIKYYEYCYQLVRKCGAILIDNTLFYGEVANPNPKQNFVKAIQEFNKALNKRGFNKTSPSPHSFEWLRKKYPLHFLLFNLFLDKKSNK